MADLREEALTPSHLAELPTETDTLDELTRRLREDPEGFGREIVPELPPLPEGHTLTKFQERTRGEMQRSRERAAVCVALRISGQSIREIAQTTSLSQRQVKRLLAQTRKKFRFNDHLAELNTEILPEAIEVLGHHLRKNKDKDVALRTMEGLGVFRSYQESRGGANGTTALQINVINGPNNGGPRELTGERVGRPRDEDGDAAV